MLASQNISTGDRDLMVAGGMESMSNAPCVASTFFIVVASGYPLSHRDEG